MIETPSACVNATTNGDCQSVMNPGWTSVSSGIEWRRSLARQNRMASSAMWNSPPTRRYMLRKVIMSCWRALRTVISPPVAMAAHAHDATSRRSGMAVCVNPRSRGTPAIRRIRSGATQMIAPIFCSSAMRSMISGSIAALDSSVTPSASTAANSTCSVAPTLGYSRRSLVPTSLSAFRWMPSGRWSTEAPSDRRASMWNCTEQEPISQPPSVGTTASPKRCSIGPHSRMGMRLLPAKPLSSARPVGRTSAAEIRSAPGEGAVPSPPMTVSMSETISTSWIPGTLPMTQSSSVSSAATMSLGTLFLAPRTVTSPWSGAPPVTSRISVVAAGARLIGSSPSRAVGQARGCYRRRPPCAGPGRRVSSGHGQAAVPLHARARRPRAGDRAVHRRQRGRRVGAGGGGGAHHRGCLAVQAGLRRDGRARRLPQARGAAVDLRGGRRRDLGLQRLHHPARHQRGRPGARRAERRRRHHRGRRRRRRHPGRPRVASALPQLQGLGGDRGAAAGAGRAEQHAAAAAGVGGLRRGRLAAVARSPRGEAGQHGGEVAALGGEPVGATRAGPAHNPLLLEQAQALGEQVGGDAGKGPLQLGPAPPAEQQLADDQQRPAVADDLQRAGDRPGKRIGLGHGATVPPGARVHLTFCSNESTLLGMATTEISPATPLDELLGEARRVRDRHHGTRVTYSPKVFIPLTMLCRDHCGYCTFAKPPARLAAEPYLSSEQVLEIARAGAAAGCHEALFTLGERPEERYPVAGQALAGLGHASTVEYLAEACRLVLAETGLLPHANAGALFPEELAALRRVSASQGMMLESLSERLH